MADKKPEAKDASCSLLGSFLFLLLNQDRVREIVTVDDLSDASKGRPAEADIAEFYRQCARCRGPNMPVAREINFPIISSGIDGDLSNVAEYCYMVQKAFKLSVLDVADRRISEDGMYMDILDMLVSDTAVQHIQDSRLIGVELTIEYLLRLVYRECGDLIGGGCRGDADEVSVEEIMKELQKDGIKSSVAMNLVRKPLSNILAYELSRQCMGDQDIALTQDDISEKVMNIFSKFLEQSFRDDSSNSLKSAKIFNLDMPKKLSMQRFFWAANISIGISQITQPFVQERVNMSSDYFVPESEYYSIQKTKVVKEIKIDKIDELRKIEADKEHTNWDTIEYPSMKDFILNLKTDNSYVTEDFDWKCIIYDFSVDTFRCLQYTETSNKIPLGLSDYAYFFGSRNLGWAKQSTFNVLICTDRRLRYLNCLMKNISLFVAKKGNVPLRFLAEYIYRSINIRLTDTRGSIAEIEEREIEEISKHLKFGIKYSQTHTWIKESNLNMPLSQIRDRVNPGFNSDYRLVDFICFFKHPKLPQLVSYRSSEKRAIGEKVDILPTYRKVESIKCNANSLISHFHRWILGPQLEYVLGRPLINGMHISILLPAFILLDVRELGRSLFRPIQHISFGYLEHLLAHIPYSNNTQYKLRGLICRRSDDDRYYPVSVRSTLAGGKSFEGKKPVDVDVLDIPDTIVAFILIEREAPSI